MPANQSLADMSFEEWQNRNGRFGAKTWKDLVQAPMTNLIEDKLREAVAYFLYIESKDVPDDKAKLYRAAALALIDKPVDPRLLAVAREGKSNDDPLYETGDGVDPTLSDVWEYHHRIETDPVAR
jgi:hypothetical protein